MAVIQPELGTEGLADGGHRILLAGPIEALAYPPLCPNCGAQATQRLPVVKVFMFNNQNDGPWQHRIARADPLFCAECVRRHRSEHRPITAAERLKSIVFSELAFPGFLTAAFALFLIKEGIGDALRDAGRGGPLFAFAAILALVSWLCFRAAASRTAHRRIPALTSIQRAFDFGDDGTTAFTTIQRSYVIRNPHSAEAFERLNAARSEALTGPEAKARDNRRTWLFGLALGGFVLAYWLFQ